MWRDIGCLSRSNSQSDLLSKLTMEEMTKNLILAPAMPWGHNATGPLCHGAAMPRDRYAHDNATGPLCHGAAMPRGRYATGPQCHGPSI
ncbi:hypothetical protein ACOMHN_020922 [Nucella lapillus]